MVISVEQYTGLGLISLTIQNKFGCQELFKAGVRSRYHLHHEYFHWTSRFQMPCDLSTCRWTHEKTDLLINSFDPRVLWDDYGTWSDVTVSQLFWAIQPSSDLHGSRLHMSFHVLTFTNCCLQTYFIKSSRGPLKTILLHGSINTWLRNMVKPVALKSFKILTAGVY